MTAGHFLNNNNNNKQPQIPCMNLTWSIHIILPIYFKIQFANILLNIFQFVSVRDSAL